MEIFVAVLFLAAVSLVLVMRARRRAGTGRSTQSGGKSGSPIQSDQRD